MKPYAITEKIIKLLLFLTKVLLSLLNALWAIPVALTIRGLSPWRIVRLGHLHTTYIGHFVMDAGIQWTKGQSQGQSNQHLDFYFFPTSKTCNDFWAKLVKRNLSNYCPWSLGKHLYFWNSRLPGRSIHLIPMPFETSRSADVQGWLQKTNGNMPFLSEENVKAKAWLRRQGWREGEPFVCLLVRDGTYRQDSAQDYRNSDIVTYVPAAEWLADQGVWVLRMGKKMTQPIPTNHLRIIDYAFHPDKSDFLDIWLFAHCDLCISTGSGAEAISSVYCRPQLLLNFTPLPCLITWNDAMHLPKTLVWQNSGIPLTWQEYANTIYKIDGLSLDSLTETGIQVIDLSPEQILTAVQERWQRIKGIWVDTEADLDLHHRFWEIFKQSPAFDKTYNNWIQPEWIHPECRVGTIWLRSMGDAFLA